MRRTLIIALALVSVACGSRAAPRSPLKKLPPAIPGVSVWQRGDQAIITFGRFPQEVFLEGEPIRTARVQLLATSEQYPALTPEVLAAALDRERRGRLQEAREATEAATSELERRRQAAAEAAAAEAAVADPGAAQAEEPAAEEEPVEEEGEEEEGLTPDELAFRAVPRTALREWESAGIEPAVILDAARRLQVAVDLLWEQLGMPAAIVDLRRPPELPDPGTVVREAERLLRALPYESLRPIEEFLDEAVVVAEVDYEDLEQLRVGETYELAYTLQPPGTANIRTRYQLAVRGISEKNQEGIVGQLLAIAPAAVASAPAAVGTEVDKTGVRVQWEAPALDISGRPLDAGSLRYKLYRRPSGNAHDLVQLTPESVAVSGLIDTTITWGEAYVYEVRVEERPPWAPRLAAPPPMRPAALPTPTTPATTSGAQVTEPALPPLPTLDVVNAQVATALAAAAAAPPRAVAPPSSNVRRQSAVAAGVEVLAADTFPPSAVTQLEAVRAGSRVTLRWNASAAADLAGYRIYRHRVPTPELPRSAFSTTTAAAATPTAATTPPTVSETEATEAAEATEVTEAVEQQEQGEEADRVRPRDRRAQDDAQRALTGGRNALLDAGWELVTAIAILESRYIDPASDPTVDWVYVVEAVDRAGNVSPPAAVAIPAEAER